MTESHQPSWRPQQKRRDALYDSFILIDSYHSGPHVGWSKVEPSVESLYLLSHLCAVEHCRVELEGPPCEDEIFSSCFQLSQYSTVPQLPCAPLLLTQVQRRLFSLAITNTCNQTSCGSGRYAFLSITTFIRPGISVWAPFIRSGSPRLTRLHPLWHTLHSAMFTGG